MDSNGLVGNQKIVAFEDLDDKAQELIKEAVIARNFAYCKSRISSSKVLEKN